MEKLIRQEFQTFKLNPAGIQSATKIAEEFSVLLGKLEQMIPDGRELSIVKTKLEEAAFFAKRGMAKHPKFNDGQLS
jgi:hypothetical protein